MDFTLNYKCREDLDRMIAGVRQKKIGAMSLLYDCYSPVVYGWILTKVSNQADAERILSRLFLVVWTSIACYNPARCSFLIWLLQLSNKEINKESSLQGEALFS